MEEITGTAESNGLQIPEGIQVQLPPRGSPACDVEPLEGMWQLPWAPTARGHIKNVCLHTYCPQGLEAGSDPSAMTWTARVNTQVHIHGSRPRDTGGPEVPSGP